MDIVENHVFEFLQIHFGGVLRQQSARGNNVCEVNTSERKEQYRMATRFTRDSTVEKKPLTMLCAQTHVRATVQKM